ncbi:MAG: hypothetical protein E6Q34_03315 [Burkholderiaceae bacterium]|nr:MAG: hypothetical protein E6Q34_03315 [Burkholderiaceae bacterium]
MEQDKSKDKRVRWLIVVGVLILLIVISSLWQFRGVEHGGGSQAIAQKTNATTALVGAEQKVQSSVQVHGSNTKAPNEGRSKSPQTKFNNADELCKDFATKFSATWTEDQFAEALRDHIQGGNLALEEWLRTIANTGEARQKGAALSLLIASVDRTTRKEVYARTPNCDQVKECSASLEALVGQKTRPYAYALVNTAIYLPDPALYGMAHNICKRSSLSSDAFCERVGSLQWMQLDPDNGAAALYALGELNLTPPDQDQTAFENALYRFGQAKKFDVYFDVGRELPSLPSSLDDYRGRTELDSLRAYFGDISPLPPHRNIIPGCRGDYLKNANRRSLCEKVASQYLRENAFVIDRGIFLKLATNLNWDKSSLQKYADELDEVHGYYRALREQQNRQYQDASGRLAVCHRTLKWNANISLYAAKGEFKQLQQDAKEFGMSREEMINIDRRSRVTR